MSFISALAAGALLEALEPVVLVALACKAHMAAAEVLAEPPGVPLHKAVVSEALPLVTLPPSFR